MAAVIIFTIAVALGTAILQTWAKLSSHENQPHWYSPLTLNDGVFWADWCVSASLAFVYSIVEAATADQGMEPLTVAAGSFVLFIAFSVTPWVVKNFCITTQGNIKNIKYVIGLNISGICVLLVAASTGANLGV